MARLKPKGVEMVNIKRSHAGKCREAQATKVCGYEKVFNLCDKKNCFMATTVFKSFHLYHVWVFLDRGIDNSASNADCLLSHVLKR